MILGVPASELFLLAVLIGIAGLVTGILAGLFGIGGGALIVPVLYEVLGALGVDDALAELPHLTEAMLVTLGKAGIRTLDDLADLATDELIAKKRSTEQRRRKDDRKDDRRDRDNREEAKGGVLGEYGLNEEQGNEIIMAARAHWFDDEEPADESNGADQGPDNGEAADADSSQ